MAIRTLTVTLLDFGLAAAADCRIHIELIRAGRDAGSIVIPTFREEVRTDETGVATFQVWPNDEHSRYQVKIYNARGSAAVKGYFDMPDADADLADIIVFEDEFSGTAATAELAKKLTMNSNWDVTANEGLPSAPRNNHAWRLVNVPATGQPVVDGKPVKTGQVVYRRDGQWHLLGSGGFYVEDWTTSASTPALPAGTAKDAVLKVTAITGGSSFTLAGKAFSVGDLAVVLATTPSVSLLRIPATGMSAAEVAQAITDAVSAEATIRATADAALQDEIDAEEQARADADTTLQNNINAEAATRASGDAATLASAQSYADGLVVGLLDDRGNYDASTNLFPSAGGSGAAGAVLKGDLWTISVAGVLGGKSVSVGDVIRALVDAPGQTAANWAQTENNLGYVPENSANKSTDLSSPDDTKFPTTKAVADALPYRGTYISLAALQAAVPAGNAGNYAYVDAGSGSSAYQYIWDANEGWVLIGLVPIADQTLLGNISGGAAAPVALNKGQVQALLRQNAAFVAMAEGATYVVAAGTSSLHLTHGSARTNLTIDCSALEVGDPPFVIYTNLAVGNLTLSATGFGVAGYRSYFNSNSAIAVSKTGSTTLAVSYLPSPWLEEVRDNSGIHATRTLRAIRVPNSSAQGTNVDFALGLRGNGAFSLAVPDGATAGGNKRGTYAVDLQLARNAATQVASGNYSILLAGERCTASSSHSGAGGYSCSVAGQYSFAYGGNHSVSGNYSVAFCGSNTINASAVASVALGFGGILGGQYNIGFGAEYRDRDMSGLLLHAANNNSGEAGFRQKHARVLKRDTSDATPVYLSWTGSDGTTSQYVLDAGRIAVKRVRVVAVNSARTAHAVWEGTVIVQRKTTAASTTVLLDTITQISSSGTGNTWVVAAAADTTNGLLSLNITGEAGTTIRWTADVDTLEST